MLCALQALCIMSLGGFVRVVACWRQHFCEGREGRPFGAAHCQPHIYGVGDGMQHGATIACGFMPQTCLVPVQSVLRKNCKAGAWGGRIRIVHIILCRLSS